MSQKTIYKSVAVRRSPIPSRSIRSGGGFFRDVGAVGGRGSAVAAIAAAQAGGLRYDLDQFAFD